MTNATSETGYQGPAVFSYGFRPFFLGAAVFAGVALPAWVLALAGVGDLEFLYPARDWHVHEMVFGFLPAVITGFLLTAIPNWTDRPPIRGHELMLLFTLWMAGRVLIAIPRLTPLVSAIVDASFLVAVAGVVWREIAAGKSWLHAPMGGLISLLVTLGALLRVIGPTTGLPTNLVLGLAVAGWSGAYLLFAVVYGPFLLRPSLDE